MNQNMRLPYTSLGKKGVIEVTCEPNKGPYDSGLYLIQDLNCDMNLCAGYPVMKAEIIEYEGSGYATACSWIQVINDKYYDAEGRLVLEDDEVDVCSRQYREIGFPFFAQGFLPSIFDAPCCNLGEYRKLDWTAATYLVSSPTRMNSHKIDYLAGFEWGYTEQRIGGTIEVEIKKFKTLSSEDWKKAVAILKRDYPKWDYE